MINYKENQECKTAIIEINRPTQLNALNNKVITDLSDKLNDIEHTPSIRSVIISGVGDKAFVAGADIKEFQDFTTERAIELSKSGKIKLFNKISHFSKPVISAINGYALGGGLELALSTHIRIASSSAKLGLPECSLGLIPGYSGTQKLPQIIGVNLAMEMILTAKMINAEEAHRIGLVNHVVEQDNLLEKCLKICKLFHGTSPEALSSAIKSINSCYLNEGDDVESREFGALFETDNFKEGVNAFLQKRKPNFN
ncbi:MAG: enoyl-CoA hydratase [Flavobacteriales bacterium]|jgi:enoyl-CoA hydratase|nr:enoyl-CoA hydratase [Flavobacteriales bacterium]|tara:strand:+ start:1702 stop:2466 length:765 start_codon:yes stop_codon:yes gene_type:complete